MFSQDLIWAADLCLLAVMTLAAPWAREQKQHFFNVAPEMLLTLWVRPGLLLLGGYCFQWLLAGFLAGEPRLKAGAKKPLLVVCALLTLSWPALVLLHWGNRLGISLPGTYPLALLYLRTDCQFLPFLIGAGWYAATRRGAGEPPLM